MRIQWLLILCLMLIGTMLSAGPAASVEKKLLVVTTLPDYAFFARRIGGNLVEVSSIVRGDQDAHFIRPKPSFITQVQKADVLVATGLDLETWLATVVDKSGNRRVRSGQVGFVSASRGVPLLEKPKILSRVEGGLHVYGNPHFSNSPIEMKVAIRNIATGLTKNLPMHAETFAKNRKALEEEMDRRLFGPELLKLLGSPALTKLARSGKLPGFIKGNSYRGKPLSEYAGGWLSKMLPLSGREVVTYHKNWVYFLRIFGMKEVGTVEPKPGIPPSPKHVAGIVALMRKRKIRVILAANYFDEGKVRDIARSVGAIPVIVPLYVGGAPETGDYFRLADLWVNSLTAAVKKAKDSEE